MGIVGGNVHGNIYTLMYFIDFPQNSNYLCILAHKPNTKIVVTSQFANYKTFHSKCSGQESGGPIRLCNNTFVRLHSMEQLEKLTKTSLYQVAINMSNTTMEGEPCKVKKKFNKSETTMEVGGCHWVGPRGPTREFFCKIVCIKGEFYPGFFGFLDLF